MPAPIMSTFIRFYSTSVPPASYQYIAYAPYRGKSVPIIGMACRVNLGGLMGYLSDFRSVALRLTVRHALGPPSHNQPRPSLCHASEISAGNPICRSWRAAASGAYRQRPSHESYDACES